jgi:hypothetical protein
LANNDGWTIAHVFSQYNYLPPNFNQWNLTDNNGYTVAHIAYMYNRLPSNFDRWDLIKKD